MARPVYRSLNVAEHNCRCAPQPDGVRILINAETRNPLIETDDTRTADLLNPSIDYHYEILLRVDRGLDGHAAGDFHADDENRSAGLAPEHRAQFDGALDKFKDGLVVANVLEKEAGVGARAHGRKSTALAR